MNSYCYVCAYFYIKIYLCIFIYKYLFIFTAWLSLYLFHLQQVIQLICYLPREQTQKVSPTWSGPLEILLVMKYFPLIIIIGLDNNSRRHKGFPLWQVFFPCMYCVGVQLLLSSEAQFPVNTLILLSLYWFRGMGRHSMAGSILFKSIG